MLAPETYLAALSLTILTMLCWGSWANTTEAVPRLSAFSFSTGLRDRMAVGAIFWGLTAAAWDHVGNAVRCTTWRRTPIAPMLYAMAGGSDFNVAKPAAGWPRLTWPV